MLSFGINVARDGEVEEEQVALAAGGRLGDHLPCHDEVGRVGGRYYDVRLRESRADLGEWDGPAAQALCQVLSPLEGPVGKSQIGQPSGAQGPGDELARLSRTYEEGAQTPKRSQHLLGELYTRVADGKRIAPHLRFLAGAPPCADCRVKEPDQRNVGSPRG